MSASPVPTSEAMAFLRSIADGYHILMATTYLADEIGACGASDEYDDSRGCRVVHGELLHTERSAIGIRRAWFDVAAFRRMTEQVSRTADVLAVVDFLADGDLSLEEAARECDLDDDEIEAGCAAVRATAAARGA